MQLEQKNLELEVKNSKLETKVSKLESGTSLAFDCYLTEDWSTDGIITFNGCAVDLTTLAPWTGDLTVTEPGLWRFTFTALVTTPPGGYGYVDLKVDGQTVSRAYVDPGLEATEETSGWYPMSLNTLQQLEAGQSVTIEWTGRDSSTYIFEDEARYTHFTGAYMGSGLPTPPACEFSGQTFEYPGSCRLYYVCGVDGSIAVADCCPGVYSPYLKPPPCVSEDEAPSICNSEDVCS